MSIAGTTDVPLDLFGGLVTDMAAADLPFGCSPDCQDVAFIDGAVETRPGLQSVYAPIAGNPTVNYLKTYIAQNLAQTLLALDSSGVLWGEFAATPGTLTEIASGIVAGARAASTTLFGREYLAFGDGQFGIDLPRQYDGANFDRVSQVGPGAGPAAVADVIANISAIARASNIVSVTTATAHNLDTSDQVVIANVTAAAPIALVSIARSGDVVTANTAAALAIAAGAQIQITGVAGGSTNFNGAFTVATVDTTNTIFTWVQIGNDEAGTSATGSAGAPSDLNGTFAVASIPNATQFTYAQAGANESGYSGTANPLGSIAVGTHQVAVAFVTRQGYITQPSPAISWTSIGNCRAQVSGIPLPLNLTNIVARLLIFTASGGASFYYTTGDENSPQMQINDTTTTTWFVDFSDSDVLAGTLADPLYNLLELGECSGAIGYADRMFWWGERNKLPNWQNLTFDGGFDPSTNAPLGWTPDATFFAGGARDNGVWGGAYDILGDGATATRGLITQSAVADPLGVPRIAQQTAYSVRARVLARNAPTQGTLHIHLYSASAAINTTGLQVTAAQAPTAAWQEFIAPLTAPLLTVPGDLVLRVYADGTPNAGRGFAIDTIEIFPTAEPYNTSVVRASAAGAPENYDGVTGLLEINEGDGQAVRAAFQMRGTLLFAKDHALYSTQDSGTGEPASWTVTEVSSTVGTPSVQGVDIGEDWAVIAARQGLYIYAGGEPTKISQEIQPLWDQINWAAAHTLWVKVDTRNRRILCGVPLGSAVTPSVVLVLDYRSCYSASDIAALGPYHFSTISGKLFAAGRSRRWCPWQIVANSATLAERPDGTAQLFLGNGAANGKIYQLLDTQDSDDGAAIDSYYTTFFFLSHDLEQQFNVRSHRKLFSYLTFYGEGNGALNLSAFADNEAFASALPSLALASPAPKDLELPINVLAERAAFRLGTNSAGSWFSLQRFIPSLLPDPWAIVRGVN
jgi:hypothetical protein